MTTITSTNPTSRIAEDSIASSATDPDTSIRPFRIRVPEFELHELRRRIAETRWPDAEPVPDSSQGVQLARMQELAHYWATEYDWRTCEERLDALPQFVTTIDGLDIHFVHVRSKHANALPILVTHGWPGSLIEQLKIIGPLTDPTAFGGSAADAFDVVLPSLPGYGWSGKPTATGWDPVRIARAWNVLMERLGYERYAAQGGDWGAIVTQQMGAQAPRGLIGIHTNMPAAVPTEITDALPGHVAPPGLAADERLAFERLDSFLTHGLAYALEMGSCPQTLYGLADSPVGLAAWFLDGVAGALMRLLPPTDAHAAGALARATVGPLEGLTRDDVLDTITFTWLTDSAISASRLYWENEVVFFAPAGVAIPVAVSVFPDEIYQAPRSWAERAFPRLVHYSRHEKGGHFAAWEQPALLVADLRAAFKTLR